ncbi:putative protein [Arabidopsis thaliana]|uniref:FBD / Leucine Rich Repeat domains containing protein n=4 Tax=Arabidopsis TaxID=3701 RepID=Q9LFM0_ARATH|nr:FBD / Leucine Rich Repeat domains containing protein [Arabidopsis thaliana]KAG7601916.1 Leucine-rich repeat 2 [Arabidopsis thaliana x Arabidopsis arenosa]KAG7608864.1 Leucine-rich repeat 2 [Arabidopsis suecica]AED91668.1 FBD / Leucine Rich Repeat domains containing protein [Arabidopsis thaliana]CAB96672.1 putative protein [Arabidopsis thaliana]VYS66529.1 unnamed protein product [Arabidopsis thaliana]|eukprot:NP_196698.1 FBD / Leucine Rich Repeat domains containing protein [Arabidopsis thaliana]
MEKSKRMELFIDRNLPACVSSLSVHLINLNVSNFGQTKLAYNDHIFGHLVHGSRISGFGLVCQVVWSLKLKDEIFVDVPRMVCLPSLKTLHLKGVMYVDEGSLQRLLSNCSLLEELVVERCNGANMRKFAVIIPQSSLSYLIVNMPKLEEADIARGSHDVKKLLKSISSVKRLSLYLEVNNNEDLYGDDIVFNELEHLKFRISRAVPRSMANVVGDSMDTLFCWKQMIDVPQCLLSSLQTFKWRTYFPTEEEKGLATYILAKSCRLKTARILIVSKLDPQKELEMKNELLSSCGSTTCNLDLVFKQFNDLL